MKNLVFNEEVQNSKKNIYLKNKPLITHFSSVHSADDVRIYEREIRSLIESKKYKITLVARAVSNFTPDCDFVPIRIRNQKRFNRIIKSNLIFWKIALKRPPRIWHIHDLEMLPSAIVAARLFGQEFIWDSHEDYFIQLESDVFRSWIPRYLVKCTKKIVLAVLRYTDKSAKAILGPTEAIIIKYNTSKKFVVGNESIILDFVKVKPKYENQNFLFLGQSGDSQLLSQIVEAIYVMRDYKLVIAGRNCIQEKKIIQDKLKERVVFVGWLDRRGLAQEMEKSVLGFVTYADTLNYSEAMPTKLFEFAAAGLPIVATPNKLISTMLMNSFGGVIAQGFDAKSLRTAIQFALEKKSRWENMSLSARSWSKKKGNWNNSKSQLLDCYELITT